MAIATSEDLLPHGAIKKIIDAAQREGQPLISPTGIGVPTVVKIETEPISKTPAKIPTGG